MTADRLVDEEIQTQEEEDVDPGNVEDEAAHDPGFLRSYDISSYGADYTVDMLVKRMKTGAFYVPEFQRNYVWSLGQASRFIESLILGLPVPGVFVYKEEDTGKHLIIDGQQRLKTIDMFFSGYFNDKRFRLRNVQPHLDGRTIDTLDDADRQTLEDAIVHTTIFKQDRPDGDRSSVYHVFERLNTGASRLNPQEIRNCLYYGDFVRFLADLNELSAWRRIYGKQNNRMKDQELILRFLALRTDSHRYQRPMSEFLNRFMGAHRNLDPETADEFRGAFVSSIELVLQAIGDRAFRPERLLNAAVFDAVMVGVSRRLDKGPVNDPAEVKASYDALVQNGDFRNAYVRSTSDEENVRTRLRIATEAFATVA